MFDNAEIDKLIIYALIGLVAVLGLALIIVAVKKNTYYVDDEGREISPKRAKAIKNGTAAPVIKEPVPMPAEPIEPEEVAIPMPPADMNEGPSMMNIKADEGDSASIPFPAELPADPTDIKGLEVRVTIGDQTETQKITSFPCLIGRENGACGLVIGEPAVSRRHARFRIEGTSAYIEDVSEHNGTYLNGVKLPPLGRGKLSQGDHINLGRAVIEIENFLY